MAARDRSVSPIGTSRFERPYTPMSRHATPTTPSSNFSKGHFSKPSLSRWSETDSQEGYSTAPSSIHQTTEEMLPPTLKELGVLHSHQHFDNTDSGSEDWYAHFEADEDNDTLGDECPDGATLAATFDIPVYTPDGHEIPFGHLYCPATALNQRQLIVFIRHFYCGACQAYVKAISEGISMQDYFAIPIPTSIIIIGCGHPNLIPFYKEITGTSFPVFAEPSRRLFKKLGMVLSGSIGRQRPEYMRDISAPAWLAGQVTTIRHGLRARKEVKRIVKMTSGFDLIQAPRYQNSTSDSNSQEEDPYQQWADLKRAEMVARAKSIRKRDLIRGGNPLQIGGEFLFEDGEVIWCHRMRHYRNHVEVSDIRRLLDLDD
ncbi:hypothetical protein AMS68_005416 [Peltaster fructicola]|uniref:Thioredoxin-like fold domain-containing protein n=1 Tax=Peltaster fructicola TaxID=286661 RepID=A0A6H0XZ57_9PEZI|nr:hypothetical protein AMS68_005416 [Peltaster fructicola]